jgi:hypothetical protein
MRGRVREERDAHASDFTMKYVESKAQSHRTYFSHHIFLSSHHLHLEVAVGGVDGVGLIDHTGHPRVLIHYDLAW